MHGHMDVKKLSDSLLYVSYFVVTFVQDAVPQ
jgi:hypothetical protein